MKSARQITMVDLRTRAEEIVNSVRKGESLVLTYRGKPTVRLEPVNNAVVPESDPFYGLAAAAEQATESITNDEIDQIIYGT